MVPTKKNWVNPNPTINQKQKRQKLEELSNQERGKAMEQETRLAKARNWMIVVSKRQTKRDPEITQHSHNNPPPTSTPPITKHKINEIVIIQPDVKEKERAMLALLCRFLKSQAKLTKKNTTYLFLTKVMPKTKALAKNKNRVQNYRPSLTKWHKKFTKQSYEWQQQMIEQSRRSCCRSQKFSK